jgi:hypothetical protein
MGEFDNIGSGSPERFRFVIISKYGRTELKSAPLGWNNSSIMLKRGLGFFQSFTGGIITDYKIGSLVFINDGFRLLYGTYLGNDEWQNGLFKEDIIFAEAKLEISYLDKDWEYQLLGTFALDFMTLKTRRVKSVNGVEINAIESDTVSKYNKRKKIKVDLTRTTSLGGYNIIDYPALKKNINFPEISNNYLANWTNGETGNTMISTVPPFDYGPHEGQIYIPKMTLTETDFNETQSVVNRGIYPVNTHGLPKKITTDDCVFKKSLFDRSLIFEQTSSFGIALKSTSRNLGGTLYIAILDTDDVTVVDETAIGTFSFKNPSQTSYAILNNIEINVLQNQSVVFYVSNFPGTGSVRTFQVFMKVTEKVVNIPATTVEGIPIRQALERCAQLIFDTQYPIKSDFFNEVDQEVQALITSGLSLRGLAISDINNQIAVEPEKFFRSIGVLFNVEFGIENIDGIDKLVIEPPSYFMTDEVGLDLSDRVNPNEIEEEVIIESAIAEIEAGFDKFDYESINGRYEYNTKNSRTTVIPSNQKLDLVSDIRGDSKGMFMQLEKPVLGTGAQASEDVQGDSDVFIIKTQPDGDEWKPETDENVQILNNSSLFGDSSLNLYFTPTRILLRHKEKIATGLDKAANSLLTYQQSDKLTTLETTDGTVNIIENQDINITATAPIASIGTPKFDPIRLIVEVDFYDEDYATFMANKNKIVKLSNSMGGWMMKLEDKLDENKAKIELIKKHGFGL